MRTTIVMLAIFLLLTPISALAADVANERNGIYIGPNTTGQSKAIDQSINSQINVIYSVPSPTKGYTTGLEWDGKYLWVSDGFNGMIYYFDPVNNRVIKSFSGPTLNMRDLAWDGRNLWAASWDYPRGIYKLNPSNGAVISSFPAPFSGHPDGLTWDGRFLWIGEEGGKIYKVLPLSGRLYTLYSITVNGEDYNPRGIAWDDSHIWAGYQLIGLIKEHDIINGGIIQSFNSPSHGYQQGLAYDSKGKYLWSTGGDNMIYKISQLTSPITIRGHIESGVEACTILRTDDGSTYELRYEGSLPPIGSYVSVTGTIMNDIASICMQGPVLNVQHIYIIGEK